MSNNTRLEHELVTKKMGDAKFSDKLIDEAHENLSNIIPGITKQEVINKYFQGHTDSTNVEPIDYKYESIKMDKNIIETKTVIDETVIESNTAESEPTIEVISNPEELSEDMLKDVKKSKKLKK